MPTMTIADIAGKQWNATSPNGVTLSQGGNVTTGTMNADPNRDPLVIDIRFTPDLLFDADGSKVTITFDEVNTGGAASFGFAGPFQIIFRNELGVPLNAINGPTFKLSTGSASDTYPDGVLHPNFAHFHNIEAIDFPTLTMGVQATRDTRDPNADPAASNNFASGANVWNYVELGGRVEPGAVHSWGSVAANRFMTIHQNDEANENDSFRITVALGPGAIDGASLQQLRQQWEAQQLIRVKADTVSTAEGRGGQRLRDAQPGELVDARGDRPLRQQCHG